VAITYTLRHRPTGTETWTEVTGLTGTSHALTGLTPGVRYDVEVVAVSGGLSSPAVVAQRSTRCPAPSQPMVVPAGYALSPGDDGTNGALAASWDAVEGAVSYVVRRRLAGSGSFVAVGDPVALPSTTMSGLDGTATYDVEVAAVNVDGDVSTASTPRTAVPARIASGGTVTRFTGNGTIGDSGTTYVVHAFTTTGSSTFTLNRELVVSHLVVAGGGGGGYAYDGGPGGGGGAGGLVAGALTRSAAAIAVTVGGGGAAGSGGAGGKGEDSVLGTITALGGGSGGASRSNGGDGGSGGGGGGRHIATTPAYLGGLGLGQGTAGAGNPGATGAGGGGGAGAAAPVPATAAGGAGGAGAASSITGATLTYATGGAGGSREAQIGGSAGAGGRGEGGSGGSSNASGNVAGGAGGSGVVVLRYAVPVAGTSSTPAGVTALAAGRPGGATTGAVAVAWDAMAGATFELRHRPITPTIGAWTSVDVGSSTERLVTGLDPAATYEFSVAATVGGQASPTSQPITSAASVATGGTVTTFVGDGSSDGSLTNSSGATYVVHTFTSRGTFVMNRSIDLQYLVVAGGGGGGSRHGGGGGAGGLLTGSSSAGSEVLATPGSDVAPIGHAVVVGSGGAGTPQHDQDSSPRPLGTSGGPSSALGLTAVGGGRGGGSEDGNGADGGSGGGPNGFQTIGRGTAGQGSDGGIGTGAQFGPWVGGGGGGAGAAGSSANGTTKAAGAGGAGRSSVIAANTPTTYAGGGGGSTSESGGSGGAGGSGGGGAGAFGDNAGVNCTANTGGGGGGGGFNTSTSVNRKGGDGGSGIVVLRYRLPS
jgi:hypothetical protein